MHLFSILAQVTHKAANHAAEGRVVPIDEIWNYVTTINRIEALMFMAFGVVCLFYGWRIFKILVVITAGFIGMFIGAALADRLLGAGNQVFGGIAGLVILAGLAIPLMRYAVCILGALAGGILTSGLWYACGLSEKYIWAGALIGIIAGGMVSFIVFKIAVMLFSSLGGSGLVVTGFLAILYRYPQTTERVAEMVFTRKWFLPLLLAIPTIAGIIVQNKFVKGSKDWNL